MPAAQLPAATGGALNHAYANGSPGVLVTATETQIGAVAITPGSTTARILILARAELSKDGGTTARVATLRVRRGTQSTDPQVGPGSVTRSAEIGAAQYGPLVVLAVDAPGTTAAVTYTVRGLVSAGNSTANRFEITAVELAGASGPQGPAGPGGAAGTDGRTIRSGAGAPVAGLGVDGDFYLDRATSALYGPKVAGAWGTAVSLVGPQGPQGPKGDGGAVGPQGPQGPKGDAGPSGSALGAYLGQRQIATSGGVTAADHARLVRVAGSDVVLGLDASGFALLDWLEIRNENALAATDGIVTIDAGAAGINEADRASILLAPGDTVRLVRVAAAAPIWLTLSPIGFLALGANQYAAVDAAGSAQAPHPVAQRRQQLRRQRAGAGTELPQLVRVGGVQGLGQLQRHGTAEQARQLGRGHEIAARRRQGAELPVAARVVAQAGRIQRRGHEAVERQPAAVAGDGLGHARLEKRR